MAVAERTTMLSLKLSPELRERTRAVARRLRKSSMDVARDGLIERVEMLEEKARREEADKVAAAAAKSVRRNTIRGLNPSGQAVVGGPLTPFIPRIKTEVPFAPETDRLHTLYESCARGILAAGDDGRKIRMLAEGAVLAIRRERPLTHPPESEILAELEGHILRLREEEIPKTRTYDSLVGHVLDVSKLKTQNSG